MAGMYRQRHPERTVSYRVLFHYFEEFVAEYENRFEREYGYFRPVIKEAFLCHHEARRAVVISLCIVLDRNEIATLGSQRRLDCGNPKRGFARIRCGDCGIERLLMFSCKNTCYCTRDSSISNSYRRSDQSMLKRRDICAGFRKP